MKYQILDKINKINRGNVLISLLIVSVLGFGFNTAQAINGGVDQTIRYSGKIYDSSNNPLEGNKKMQIMIFDVATGGTAIFTETRDGSTTYGAPSVACPIVPFTSGKFDIEIGSCNKDILNNILNNNNLYIEVQLDKDGDNTNTYEEIFTPRRKLTSVPSAFNALKLVSENTSQVTGNQSSLSIDSTGKLIYKGDEGSGASQKFIIKPNGTVGIGVMDPSTIYALDVLGTFNLTGEASMTSLSVTNTISSGGNTTVGGNLSVTGLSTLTDSVDIRKNLTNGIAKTLTIANRGADNVTAGVGTSILFETSGTTYSGRSAIRSVGVGTEGQNTKLGLYTSSDGTENNLTERLTVLSSGNVGINTTTPGYALQVGNTADGTEARANAWNTLSDISVKRDITEIDQALDKINQLKGYYYYWRSDFKDQSRQVGFVSQEVNKVLPEIVSKGEDGLLSLDYAKMTPLLLESIKELDSKLKSIQLTSDLLRNSFSQENLNIKGLTADGNVMIKGDLTVLGKINNQASGETAVVNEVYNRDVNTSGDLLVTDKLLSVDASLGEISLNLINDQKLNGKEIIVKKVDNSVNKVIINNSNGLIDGLASAELDSQYQFIRIIYDGKNWNIVGKNK